jgi:hypothetical protein
LRGGNIVIRKHAVVSKNGYGKTIDIFARNE